MLRLLAVVFFGRLGDVTAEQLVAAAVGTVGGGVLLGGGWPVFLPPQASLAVPLFGVPADGEHAARAAADRPSIARSDAGAPPPVTVGVLVPAAGLLLAEAVLSVPDPTEGSRGR